MTTIVGNRGQLWTSTLSPHLESPHLDFPDFLFLGPEEIKEPQVEGSRSYQSSVTPRFRATTAPETLVLLCFGAVRKVRMIRDRSLLTS